MNQNPDNSPETKAESCEVQEQRRGLISHCSCASAAYFDEGSMERAMHRHEALKAQK
jgi:hypothetical protein